MHVVRNHAAPFDAESLWTHYASGQTTLALFGKLTPAAPYTSAAVGFTTNTRDVYLPAHGINFYSKPGITPSVIEMVTSVEASNLENVLQFSDDAITEEDLEAGKWNFASLELWLMNWAALTMGEFVVFTGHLGEISNLQTFFKAEAQSGHTLLENNYGGVTGRICRVKEFRDEFCKYSASTTPDGFPVEQTKTLSSAADKYHLTFPRGSQNVPDDFYHHGKITATAGANAGLSREIKFGNGKDTANLNIVLRRAFPFPVIAGQSFVLEVGCDRTLERCAYFGNVVNRRAEDFIPNLENANRFPPSN